MRPRLASRRAFLVDVVGLGLGAVALGCGSRDRTSTSTLTSGDAAPSTGDPITDAGADTAIAQDAAPADLDALAASLDGTVVARGAAGYDDARKLYNTRFDDVMPSAVVYCASVGDVQKTLAWARANAVPIAPRNGGHSYAGYSTCAGLVVDVTRMNAVEVDASTSRVVVGAGALLIDVYAALAPYGLAIPGGSCPTVGITGLTLGGGIGPMGRAFGLTADALREVEIVVASGDVLTCNDAQNADLFWACRGGGGGNFGIVTKLTFHASSVGSTTTYFELAWPWSAARAIVSAWQSWGPSAPDALFSICGLFAGSRLDSGGKDVAFVQLYGLFLGSKSDLEALLAPMLSTSAGPPSDRTVDEHAFLDAMLVFAECAKKTVAQCHRASPGSSGTIARETFKASSDFSSAPFSSAAIDALVAGVEARQADARMFDGGVMMDAHGGAIGRVPKDATAYVHRDAMFSLQYLAPWSASDASDVGVANLDWIRSCRASMAPFVSGEAYQNYVDPDLVDWKRAYYGDNWARLVDVKRKYDPDGVLSFAQGIPTTG